MEFNELSTNLIIQYVAVGAILLAVAVWVAVKFIKMRKEGPKSCCGCGLADKCPSRRAPQNCSGPSPSGENNKKP